MANIETVASQLRSIEYCNDVQWLEQFLDSLPIPKFALNKLTTDINKSQDRHARLLNRADFVLSNEGHYQKIISTNEKKSALLALHIDEGNITVFNRQSQTTVYFHANKVSEHLDNLLELIYGNAIRRDVESTRNFAATIAQLFNQLVTDNPKVHLDLCSKFVLDITTIAIAHSFRDVNTFEIFSKKTLATQNLDYTSTITKLMDACSGASSQDNEALLPKSLLVCIDNPAKEIYVSRSAFQLCVSILLLDAMTLDAELLASSIYKFVNSGESAGIYGHQTSHQNVLLILNPLILDELTELSVKGNNATKLKLLDRIRKLRFFDPTDGPGCFLSSTMRSLIELESQILDSLGMEQETGIQLCNFSGLVSNRTCQHLSRLTIWLTYLQFKHNCNKPADGSSRINLSSISIHLGNQLESDWTALCQIDSNAYILGCPKFLGSRKMSPSEKLSLSKVFKTKKLGDCDMSSGWLIKSSEYVKSKSTNVAFIMTNSVCQGSQVGVIWPQVFANGTKISFARPSMKWRSGTERVSEVTVVLIGLSPISSHQSCRIHHESKYIETSVIGPYLVAGSDLIVYERRKALVDFVPAMRKGNMPYDNGYLLLNEVDRDRLIAAAPSASRFLKRIVGSDEYIHKKKRWCIWLQDEDLHDAEKITEIAERIEAVRKSRSGKSDAGAIRLAARPHQFRETRSTIRQTLVVPSVSSENRAYIPIGFIGSGTVVSNLAFAIYECEPWVFSLLTSQMHNIWIRTVCGALETRIRYSNTLGYNTFPFPTVSDAQKKTLDKFAHEIIAERECYPEMTLGDLYSNLPEPLRIKHEYLDVFVDSMFSKSGFKDDNDRLQCLFQAYKTKS
jgi:hypothetical protein